jgi:hypothetical protein
MKMCFIGKYRTCGVKQLGVYLDPDACLNSSGSKENFFKAELERLVGSALSVSTWRKHGSGWNAYQQFENYCDEFLYGHYPSKP